MDATGAATASATARAREVVAPAPPEQATPETVPGEVAVRPWLRVIQGGGAVEPPPIDKLASLASRADAGGRVRMIDALQRTVGNKAATELISRPGRFGPAEPPADPRDVGDGTGRVRRLARTAHPHLTLLAEPTRPEPIPTLHLQSVAAATTPSVAAAASAPPTAVPATAQRDLADDLIAAGRALLGRLRNRAAQLAGSIRDKAGAAWERVSSIGSTVLDSLGLRADAARETLSSAWDSMTEQAGGLAESLTSMGGTLAEQLRGAAAAAGEALAGGWDGLKSAAGSLVAGLKAKAEELLASLKSRGADLFAARIGGNGAECLTPETLDGARSAFDPARSDALASLDGSAAGVFDQLGTLWSSLQGAGRSGLATVGELAGSLGTALDGAATGAVEGLRALGSAIGGQADGIVAGLRELGSSLVTDLLGEGEGAAAEVDGEAQASVGGLRGMTGGIAASLTGEADGIIGAIGKVFSGIVGDIRRKTREIVGKIRDKVNALLDRILELVRRLLAGAQRAVAALVRKAQQLLDALRRAWAAVKRTILRVISDLTRRWNSLAGKARSFWTRIKGALRRLASRATAALSKTEGESCELPAAAREGEALSEMTIGGLVGELPLFKRRGGAVVDENDVRSVRAGLGRGVAFEGAARSRMETAFGRDFGGVRLHTDGKAAATSNRLDARAFALGGDIAFAANEYRPGTLIGDALLAHELAHVSAAGESPGGPALRDDRSEDSAVEQAADRSAIDAVAHLWFGARRATDAISTTALPAVRSGLRLRRCATAKCCDFQPPAIDPKLAEADHDCSPLPADRADVFALKTGKKKTLLYGNTGFLAPPTGFQEYGRLDSSKVETKCGERCKLDLPAPPRFRLSPFIFTKAGEYPEGKRKVKTPGKHFGKVLPAFEVVTPALAERIAEAEREHCRDHKAAWKKGYGKYIAAVASLQDGFCIPPVPEDAGPKGQEKACRTEYERLLKERAGTTMAGADSLGQCMHPLTITERDDKGTHTLQGKPKESVDDSGTKILLTLPDNALPDLGSPSSDDLMKGCDI